MSQTIFNPSGFVRLAVGISLQVVMLAAGALAQEKAAATAASATATRSPSQPAEAEGKFPEIEAVASDVFQSVSYIQPLFSHLHFEGHYFGVEQHVGTVGASWAFRLGKHVKLVPGLGVYFGEQQTTAPALTFRWEIENKGFISQGLFIQALRKSEEFGYPSIWDSNHLSARWLRLEIGPSWERIHSREGNEWKGGGRFAFRIFKHASAVLFVLAPETEVRGGIIIHPTRREP